MKRLQHLLVDHSCRSLILTRYVDILNSLQAQLWLAGVTADGAGRVDALSLCVPALAGVFHFCQLLIWQPVAWNLEMTAVGLTLGPAMCGQGVGAVAAGPDNLLLDTRLAEGALKPQMPEN